jgi:hypothetical protein
MNKNYFTLILFALMFSKIWAQPLPPNAIYPFNENFESFSGFSSTMPDWTQYGAQTFYPRVFHGAGSPASKGLSRQLFNLSQKDSIVLPLIGPLNNNSGMAFEYRVAEYIGTTASSAPILGSNFSIVISVSTNNGTTYVPVLNINPTNHVSSTSFASKSFGITQFADSTVKIKIVLTRGSQGDFWIDFDNINIGDTFTNLATQNLKSAVQISSFNKTIDVRNFEISALNIEIYDILGKRIANTMLSKSATHSFSIANTGLYFVKYSNAAGQETVKKVVVE